MTTASQQTSTPAPAEITHEVAVHKANLALAKDESVYDFTGSLGEQVRAYVYSKKGMDTTKSDYCYLVEVYPTTVIVSYSLYSNGSKGSYGYVSVTYERDTDTKVFTFSNMVEVERVTTYRPKTLFKVLKSATGASADVEVWAPGEGAPGWSPATKSFWNGVV